MVSAPNVIPHVELGCMDGSVRSGRLARFEPTMKDLILDSDRGRTSIPAEQIAYIGFHRDQAVDASYGLPPGFVERFRIHVPGGKTFSVEALAASLISSLGFRGCPTDPSSSFQSIFFYRHGVKAHEKDVALGEMLVQSGLVTTGALQLAIDAQSLNRSAPLGQILVERGQVDGAAITTALSLQARRKLRIGKILVEAGLATQASIDSAVAEQKNRKGKRLGEVLVEMGFVTERNLMTTLASKFQLRLVNLEESRVNPAAAAEVPRDVIIKHGVLPIEVSPSNLTLAISDPLAIDAIDLVRFHAKRQIDEVLVAPSQLKQWVDAYLRKASAPPEVDAGQQLEALLKEMRADDATAGAEIDDDNDEDAAKPSASIGGDDGIVKVVNHIIIDAYRRGASDIHIEPNGKERDVSIRFRIDGDCFPCRGVPAGYRNQLVSRIKIMASLDIAERRKPQDGKMRFRLGEKMIELRVATLPTVNKNEDIVLRILASAKPLPLDQIGLSERNLREVSRAIRQPYGLILCVGPTGSGKTTTLHSALGFINKPDTKIWTAEDPVEITQPGLRQVQVSPKIGLTFATAMRAFLRADPDVIMVGEMRDHETASTAIESSLTGHLVLSTLHTNSAPETITRLLDMGLDPFSFGDSLLAIIAQRLTRSLCKRCRVQEPGTPTDFADIARGYDERTLETMFGVTSGRDFRTWRAKGCDACGNTGYKGRLALHEVLVSDNEIRRAIAHKEPVEVIRRAAIATGMTTLLQDGIAKALAGHTDMTQVLAVCMA
jgi:type II secretory ATPase GspE/PulE/Tfp pilus assembly ATPase PilB-like protein